MNIGFILEVIDAKIGMRFWKCGGEFVGLKKRGPAAEAEAMGPFLLVDFRRKSLEHAMHPQGGDGFKGFAPAASPFALWRLESCKTVREHGLETQAVNLC